jgi:hypothetical protein
MRKYEFKKVNLMKKNPQKYFSNNGNDVICNVKKIHNDLFLQFISKF